MDWISHYRSCSRHVRTNIYLGRKTDEFYLRLERVDDFHYRTHWFRAVLVAGKRIRTLFKRQWNSAGDGSCGTRKPEGTYKDPASSEH